jgi:hypothetical protein
MVTQARLVDGAVLRLRVPGAGASPVSSQAFFALPGAPGQMLRAQPAGFSRDLERWLARGDFADRDYVVHERREQPFLGGTLRLAEVSHRTVLGGRRRLALACFEHRAGCLLMSRAGRPLEEAERLMERLPIETDPGGVWVASPVVADVRPPAALTYVPGLGQLVVNPLTRPVLRQLPGRPGRRVAHGELYRAGAASRGLLFVGRTCRVAIEPERGPVDMDVAARLDAEWVKAA